MRTNVFKYLHRYFKRLASSRHQTFMKIKSTYIANSFNFTILCACEFQQFTPISYIFLPYMSWYYHNFTYIYFFTILLWVKCDEEKCLYSLAFPQNGVKNYNLDLSKFRHYLFSSECEKDDENFHNYLVK